MLSKLSMAAEKGWNIGVTPTTTAQEILNIVCRALKVDPSQAFLCAASTRGGTTNLLPRRSFSPSSFTEAALPESAAVLDVWNAWQREGVIGRFLLKDRAPSSGADLLQRLTSSPVLSRDPMNSQRPRGINTTNTFSGAMRQPEVEAPSSNMANSPSNRRRPLSVASVATFGTLRPSYGTPTPNRKLSAPTGGLDPEAASAIQHLQLIDERSQDFLEKKTKISNLLQSYSQQLASSQDPNASRHLQEQMAKANAGLRTIEVKLAELSEERSKVQVRLEKSRSRVAAPAPQDLLQFATNHTFQPLVGVEERLMYPPELSAKLSSETGRGEAFKQMLNLVRRKESPEIQEKALQLVASVCQMPQNQPLVLQSELLLILIALRVEPNVVGKIKQMGCLILSTLSTVESNKTLIVQANGMDALVADLSSTDDVVLEQTTITLANMLGSRRAEIVSSFRAAKGFAVIVKLLVHGKEEKQRINALKLIVVLGLPMEDKEELVSTEGVISAIIQSIDSPSIPAQKLAVMILGTLSALPQSQPIICKAHGFVVVAKLLKNPDPRLVDKAILIVNNLAMGGDPENLEDSEKSITPLISLLSHSDAKLRSKAIRCLSNLVLIDEDHLEAFYNQNGLKQLISVLVDRTPEVLADALRLLVNVTHESVLSDSIRSEIGNMGAVGSLVQVIKLRNASSEVTEQAMKALVNISISYLNEAEYLDTDLIPLLLSFFSSPSASSCEFAAATLVNLTRRSDKLRDKVRTANGLAAVMLLCESPLLPIRVQACRVMTNMALNGRCRFLIQNSPKGMKLLVQMSVSQSDPEVSESATQALRNASFPCEDYSNEIEEVQETSSSKMEAMIKQAALEAAVIEEENSTDLPISHEQAIQRARRPTLVSASPPVIRVEKTDDELDDFLSELAEEESHSASGSKSLKQEDQLAKAEDDLFAMSQRQKLQRGRSTLDDTLNEMEALVDTIAVKRPPTAEELAKQENERVLQEQRMQLEEERRKFQEERVRFEEERTRLQTERENAELVQTVAEVEPVPIPEAAPEEEIDPAKLEKYNTKRMKIAVELLVTERSYVDSLNTLVNKYMNPMAALALARRPIIKKSQVAEIFANVEEIINYHTMLLEGVERRVSKWDEKTCLGEFFISMVRHSTQVHRYHTHTLF